MSAPSHVVIDNLRRTLDSAALASVITCPIWEDRILGVSQMAHPGGRCGWIATGNNPALSAEMSRRAVSIRLDAKRDRPWQRQGFRHPNLRGWCYENRPQLVWAALVLIKAWIAAGRPKGQETLGMFESWAETMGGILHVAGVPGFMENAAEFYDTADAERAVLREFLGSWYALVQSREILAADLFSLAEESLAPLLGEGKEQSRKIRFGQLLGRHADRVYDVHVEYWEQIGPTAADGTHAPIEIRRELAGEEDLSLRIVRGGKFRRAQQWRLEKVGDTSGV